MREFSTFRTSPETKPEITHEDNAGNSIKQIAHSDQQISMLARKQDDKLYIDQIQSLIKEKAMQGINTSICLLIFEEDIYFENLVTNIQKLYKQISGILSEAISLWEFLKFSLWGKHQRNWCQRALYAKLSPRYRSDSKKMKYGLCHSSEGHKKIWQLS